jgi:hypothetical protein
VLDGPHYQLRARAQPQFPKHVAEVALGRSLGDHERVGDLSIAQSLRHQSGDVSLTRRQPLGGVSAASAERAKATA